MADATERVLPHDLGAERAVLGAILVEAELLDVATGAGLLAGHFFRQAHRFIFEAYGRVRASGLVVDVLTLRADLERVGTLEEVGGMIYLAGLTEGVPRAVNVESYARIVREKAQLRDLIAASNRTIADAYHGGDAVEELMDQAEARIAAIGRDASRGDFLLASDWMAEMYAAVDAASVRKRAITGIPCGLDSIDRLTRGWQPADLILIAARPSVGKTSIALQFALEASRHTSVAFVSLEMSRQAVGFRAVALEARVDAFRLMTGQLVEHEMRRVGDAISRLAERPFAIDDASGQGVAGLCAKVRRLAARYGTGIVFVDYLQLMHGSGAENRNQEITQISGRLKGLAKEMNVPVVALSQLTRESARSQGSTRPQLHNLRDGGALEQDADVVLLLHRPNQQGDGARYQHGETAEIILAKQRNGPAGRVIETAWDGPTMRFADKAPADVEQGTLAEARFGWSVTSAD